MERPDTSGIAVIAVDILTLFYQAPPSQDHGRIRRISICRASMRLSLLSSRGGASLFVSAPNTGPQVMVSSAPGAPIAAHRALGVDVSARPAYCDAATWPASLRMHSATAHRSSVTVRPTSQKWYAAQNATKDMISIPKRSESLPMTGLSESLSSPTSHGPIPIPTRL